MISTRPSSRDLSAHVGRRPQPSRRLLWPWAAAVAATAALLAAAVALLGGGSPPPWAAAQRPVSWTAAYMADDHTYTEREAVALAERFDVVAGLPTAFRQWAGAMRRANPQVVLLVYTNGMFVPPEQGRELPDEWFARDAQGRRIASTSFGNLLMDPESESWRDYSVERCRRAALDNGYDGCIVDMLTLGVFAPGYLTALPVREGTTSPYTREQYRDALVPLAEQFADLEGLVVAGNTVTTPARHLDDTSSTREVSKALSVAQAEDFLRGAGDPVDRFPDVTSWQQHLQVVRDLESDGTAVLATTKLWVPAEPEQRDAWQRYAMASFLLATEGTSAFAFTSERTPEGAAGSGDRYRLPEDLGLPQGPVREVDGLFVRDYEGGIVAVNPGDRAAVLTTEQQMQDLDGRTGASSTVAPRDATILRRSGSDEQP